DGSLISLICVSYPTSLLVKNTFNISATYSFFYQWRRKAKPPSLQIQLPGRIVIIISTILSSYIV
ncbi:MAG TPA: hypothetical protein VFY41_05780, partial [Nitrososphaeraceae archaeon]|nr:hypothetical protein [Nitrososphaeraceae archaeon]